MDQCVETNVHVDVDVNASVNAVNVTAKKGNVNAKE